MSWWTRIVSLLGRRVKASTTLRAPDEWFLDWLGGSRAATGQRIGTAEALGLSPYYAGLRAISETVGSLPLHVMQTDGPGTRRLALSHPAYVLLHDAPNRDMTAMSWRSALVAHAIHYGNGYAEIEWDSYGRPSAIWPLAETTKPETDSKTGRLTGYTVLNADGSRRFLYPADVIHVPGLGFDGVQGYGLIQVALESMGLHKGQETYAARYFANGGNVSAVVETDQVLGDESFARLQTELRRTLTGLDNAHNIALLEAGLKLKPINLTHEQAQLIESRRFSVEEWARWLNIPPHKLRDLTHATFSNIEHQAIEFVQDTIRPWLVKIEQELNRKLFRQRNRFYCRHSVEGLLRGDVKARYEAYALALSWGWLSQNDVRELEDLNPIEHGDDHWIQLNMQKLGEPRAEAVPPAGPEPEPEDDDSEGEDEDEAPQARRRAVVSQLRLVAAERDVDTAELDRRIASVGW